MMDRPVAPGLHRDEQRAHVGQGEAFAPRAQPPDRPGRPRKRPLTIRQWELSIRRDSEPLRTAPPAPRNKAPQASIGPIEMAPNTYPVLPDWECSPSRRPQRYTRTIQPFSLQRPYFAVLKNPKTWQHVVWQQTPGARSLTLSRSRSTTTAAPKLSQKRSEQDIAAGFSGKWGEPRSESSYNAARDHTQAEARTCVTVHRRRSPLSVIT